MDDNDALGRLVTVKSSSGLDLDGILFRANLSRVTIVHVHGSFGNFYQGRLVRMMAGKYIGAGINLLSLNMASHDGLAEGYRSDDECAYVGGAIGNFGECVADIEGAVNFVSTFSDRVILQGHSLGCDRILQYLIERQAKNEFVLLAPCDSYQLQANWIAPETVEEQITRIRAEPPRDPLFDWLPSNEYGVKGGNDWTYAIPITRLAFLSIAEGPPYRLMKIKKPAKFFLDQRALVCIGGADALQVWPNETMFEYLGGRIAEIEEVFEPSGDHFFSGLERRIIERIIRWVLKLGGEA